MSTKKDIISVNEEVSPNLENIRQNVEDTIQLEKDMEMNKMKDLQDRPTPSFSTVKSVVKNPNANARKRRNKTRKVTRKGSRKGTRKGSRKETRK